MICLIQGLSFGFPSVFSEKSDLVYVNSNQGQIWYALRSKNGDKYVSNSVAVKINNGWVSKEEILHSNTKKCYFFAFAFGSGFDPLSIIQRMKWKRLSTCLVRGWYWWSLDSAIADLLSENSVGWHEVQTEKFFCAPAHPHEHFFVDWWPPASEGTSRRQVDW